MSTRWVIVSRATGKPVMETFSQATADLAASETLYGAGRTYEVLTSYDWLIRYNRLVREAGGVEPSAEAFLSAVGVYPTTRTA